MITFRYKLESIGSSKIFRPIAEVQLKSRSGHWIKFNPYIDSGADLTMIPLSLGRLLGLQIKRNQIKQIGGISGSVAVSYHVMPLKIESYIINTQIAWAHIEDVPPLLGRKGVFDNFNITFKQKQREVEFVYHENNSKY